MKFYYRIHLFRLHANAYIELLSELESSKIQISNKININFNWNINEI